MENQNQKQQKEEVIHINKEEKKVDYTKIVFGLIIVIVGVIYLGNTMSIWNFEFNSIFIWPVFLIVAGLLVMGNRLILKTLIIMSLVFIFVIIASMLFYHLKTYQESKEIIMGVDRADMQIQRQSFSVYKSSSGDYDYSFSANMNRWQLEERIGQVLDDLYYDNLDQPMDIEFNIKKIK